MLTTTKLLSYDNKTIIMSIFMRYVIFFIIYYCKAFLVYRKKAKFQPKESYLLY